jgi:hypothetical protein
MPRACRSAAGQAYSVYPQTVERQRGWRQQCSSVPGALDAVGAMLGSFGLAAFTAVIWLLIGRSPSLALLLATAAWLAVALLAWIVRRRL